MKTKHPRKTKLAFSFASCTAAMLLAAQTLSAATVVLEDFDDLNSQDKSIAGQSTGINWPGGTAYAATGTPPTYDSGINMRYYLTGYTNTGNQSESSGSLFNNDSYALGGTNYLKRTFSSSSLTGTSAGNTVWISALMAYSVANANTAAYIMFNNVGLRFGMQGGKLIIADSNGNIKTSSTGSYAVKQTHLVVFGITLYSNGTNSVQGWIDPASATSLGTAVVSTPSALSGSTLNGDVEFSLRGTSSGEYVSLDSIRIAYGSGASLSNVMAGQ